MLVSLSKQLVMFIEAPESSIQQINSFLGVMMLLVWSSSSIRLMSNVSYNLY